MSVTEEQIAELETLAAKADLLAISALLAEAVVDLRRLRSLLTSSPAGTVRLLFRDGTHRDVDPGERCAMPGETLDGSVLRVRDRRGADAETQWGRARVESWEQEAARERAARLEAERQRDEAHGRESLISQHLRELADELIELKMCVDGEPVSGRETTTGKAVATIERLRRQLGEARVEAERWNAELAETAQELHAVHSVLDAAGVKYGVPDPKEGVDFSTAKRVEEALRQARGAPTAPASAPLRERLGRLAYEAWTRARLEADGLRAVPFYERPDELREADRRIGEAVLVEVERLIGASLQDAGRELLRSEEHEDRVRGAGWLTAGRDVLAGKHREPKEGPHG